MPAIVSSSPFNRDRRNARLAVRATASGVVKAPGPLESSPRKVVVVEMSNLYTVSMAGHNAEEGGDLGVLPHTFDRSA
jgi:hypothetical protein